MKIGLHISAVTLAASCSLPADALPPPLPIAVTIVMAEPEESPKYRHTTLLVQALADENWIKIVQPAYVLLDQEKGKCLARREMAGGCLRTLNRDRMSQFAPSAPHLAPHVILLVQGDAHQAKLTCVGALGEPSKPDAQSIEIDIQAALFASREERRVQRQAIVQCLLATAAEGR